MHVIIEYHAGVLKNQIAVREAITIQAAIDEFRRLWPTAEIMHAHQKVTPADRHQSMVRSRKPLGFKPNR